MKSLNLSLDSFCARCYHDHSLILPTTGWRPYLGAAKLWALLSWVMWGHIGSPKAVRSSLHVYWWRPLLYLVSNGLHSVVSVVHLPSLSYIEDCPFCSLIFLITLSFILTWSPFFIDVCSPKEAALVLFPSHLQAVCISKQTKLDLDGLFSNFPIFRYLDLCTCLTF